MKIQIKDLVFDERIYPRNSINETNVQSLLQTLKAGGAVPVIIVEAGTNRIVDGYHRTMALKRFLGEDAAIEAEPHTYANDMELFEDAMRRNSNHGLRMQAFDISKSIVMGSELGIPVIRLAAALNITVEKVNWHLVQRTRPHPEDVSRRVPIKSTQSWTPPESPLTKKQLEGQKKLLGLHVAALAKKITEALDSDNVNLDDPNTVKALANLYQRLGLVSEIHAAA